MVKLSIIIPTLNEADNISELLERLDSTLSQTSYETIFVDDNSTDGTPEVIEDNIDEHDYNAKCLVRDGTPGLSISVIEGINKAKGDFIAVMDADLQHPPEKVSEMIHEIESGKDLVIASREMQQSKIVDWSVRRFVLSKLGNLIARQLSFLDDIRDPLSGFFIFRRGKVQVEKLDRCGFKILLEVLKRPQIQDVQEIPYVFKGRKRGNSNLSLNHHIKFFKQLISLQLKALNTSRKD